MRKPDFCICENKDADQLRGNREADQCLCFRHMDSASSIGAPIGSFQDGRHGSKMAARTSRWPLWLRPSPVKGHDL